MLNKIFATRYLAFSSFILAAAFWAYHRLNPLLFNPVNGDFQTFNPISRLMDGQFPYHDFANYLGMGPLTLTTLATLPTGVSFASSVASTEILVSIAFLYMATTGFRLLGTPRPWLFAIGLYLFGRLPFFMELLPSADVFHSLRFLLKQITTYLGLKFMVAPGHSLMPIRALWPFLAAVPFIFYLRAPSMGRAALLGAALGVGLFWSNDYGPTTALVFGLVAAFSIRNLRHIGLAVLASLAAAAFTVTVVTGGHPGDWLTFNRAVSQDQFWYYYFPDKKVISLDTFALDEATWVLLIILMSSIPVFQWVRRRPTPEMLAFLAIFLTALLAGLLSMFGSSWFSYYLATPTLLCVIAFLHHYAPVIRKRINPDGVFVRMSFGAIAVACVIGFVLHPSVTPASANEVKLGAKLHSNYDGFDDMMTRVRSKGGNVWSTYSTSVEASLGKHHPTGQDYIIHALGDSGRAKYLKGFREATPNLVITPRPDKILWEVWARIINWWFYRELMRDYQPVGHGPYWTLWERSSSTLPNRLLACTVHQVTPSSVTIEIHGGAEAAGHVADVQLTYTAKSAAFTRLLLEIEDEGLKRQYLQAVKKAGLDTEVYKSQSSVGFPPNAGTWHIPIQLDEQGTGRSAIHANRRSNMGSSLKVSACAATDWAPSGRIDQ